MKTTSSIAALSLSLAFVGCGTSSNGGRGSGPTTDKPDLVIVLSDDDGGVTDNGDMADTSGPDVCGDPNMQQDCASTSVGPPNGMFPLQSDQMKNPAEQDNGVNRDKNGWLGLDSTHAAFNYLWIANSGEGTTSKIDSKTVREVARYPTVTCFSLKTGSTAACDMNGNGCCSIDDYQRWTARKNKQAQPAHQAVDNTGGSNAPSRTSVDFNGDLFISNRAFGGQSSVTHIANDIANCIDRNRNGKIDTSKDVNGDGLIDKNDPKEYLGQDDECVLWTSNTNPRGAIGRPLSLAQGAKDANVSDAWAGSWQNGNFVRIDGKTGLDLDEVQLPGGCMPYGLAVDASGYAWAPNLGSGPLCYFNTKNTMEVGRARDPNWGPMQGYGVTMDRDQNVWVGSGVERYTPDRSNGFKNLGNGWWTKIGGANGIGIAADARTPKDYWVWSCSGGNVIGIPGSKIPVMKGMDQTVNLGNGPDWPRINMPCYGVGVDSDQNVWGVDSQTATRAVVDKMAGFKPPVLNGQPMGNNKCPAGDQCPIRAGAYTYSDFTGFGLRNFTRPTGTYSMVVPGCSTTDQNQNVTQIDTQWYSVVWDADVPPNTSILVHARSGNSPSLLDPSWNKNAWTTDSAASPLNLQATLSPNVPASDPNATANDAYLQVEFTFKTNSQNATPKLKSFQVGFKCVKGPG